MAVITISRQYGSGGNEIAAQVCEMLGYRSFDKRLMAQVAHEMGLAENEIVDFSENDYKVGGFLDRLINWRSSRVIAQTSTWKEETSGARVKAVEALDESYAISLVQSTIHAAYKRGNVVIVGRGGQVILKEKPDALHVRLEAPLETRLKRVQTQEGVSPAVAQDIITSRDRAAADYLKRFYNINWADPMLYHLVINTGRWEATAAARLIVNAASHLPKGEST